ncbi:MAG: tyrosine-type recombinase/integrase [Bradyrhizobium sp.]
MRLKLYRGWWYAVWREDGETRRRALRTQDRDAAARALADYQRLVSTPDNTVASIYTSYLADKGTERARWAWIRLGPALGALRPDQIDKPTCRIYVDARRAAGAGDGTIHTELTFLRAALRWHSKATTADVELPPKPAPADLHLTRQQYERLVAAAEAPHVRLFIILALATAGRAAAILDLTWDRVEFDRGLIRLGRGEKRRKGRATVPMTDSARRALVDAARARTSEYVIEYGGERVGRINRGFAATAERAGLPWCTPHVMRHTAAVWMAEDEVPMAQIAQVLGHSDSRITERIYARFSPSYLRRAVRALG